MALTQTECQSSVVIEPTPTSQTAAASRIGDWREVAPGVFVTVAEPAAVNLGLVVGSGGALVIDTGSSPQQGRQLRAAVATVTERPLVGAVVTHWHYDHAFGMAAFDDLGTVAHESVRARLRPSASLDETTGQLGFRSSELVNAHREIAVAAALDLGDRRVEIAHLGQGHTEGDLIVVVPDADVVFTGDLLESAGAPWFGDDSFPHEWGATLDGVIGLMTSKSRAVPGHGDPVDREFVFGQRSRIAAVSGEIRRLVDQGVAGSEALQQGSWPFPEANVAAGVARGYAQLADHGLKGVRPTLPLA